ncbi:MAG TPA: NAD-dependent deacylase [Anaerolineales bacterium]|nr:NAD-dependent deacylase [Anaerolineales bacterium]
MDFDEKMIDQIRQAGRIAALTGAGISKESGIPTFREAQTGLWAQYEPTELATPQAFRRNPELVWEWYQWRRGLVREAQPNPGHKALVQMAAVVPQFSLITQNVDGFHQMAGSRDVIELHGSIMRTKCFTEGVVVEDWQNDGAVPPKCPRCGGLLRPDVVWFGENLPVEAIGRAVEAAESVEVFFSIGTSAVVEPAASLPRVAKQAGGLVIEINPDATPLTPLADYHLKGPSGVVLPDLIQQVWDLG